MYALLKSYSLQGLEAESVDVEVTVSPGLPRFEIIGLADAAIRESRERIFQSLRHFGFAIPPGSITVNLAPAERRKRGTGFDLPIALGLLIATGQVRASDVPLDTLVAGELSLDGRLQRCTGLFNAALSLRGHMNRLLFPSANRGELSHFRDLLHHPVETLSEAIDVMEGNRKPELPPAQEPEGATHPEHLDYSQVWGNTSAIRAIQLAILARMNLLLIGSPGCGKTLLLRRIPTLLPKLSEDESLEVTRIHAAGGHPVRHLVRDPPFREVHSGVSAAPLIGGGLFPTPGEISLAHRGILFLDELAEFPRQHLQALRTPLSEKRVTISRLSWQATFPSDFQLAAAMNPCPCGFFGDELRTCICPDGARRAYMARISGPLLDRIDLILYVHSPKESEVFRTGQKSSTTLKEEMRLPADWLAQNPDHLNPDRLRRHLEGSPQLQAILRDAYTRGLVSLRRVGSVLRAAATLALLDGNLGESKDPREEHLYAALQFCRPKWATAA
ncbi:MAG: YifB family Mg chelatase-like AAA ATPase [Spirochaetes bacterium]|nr:YifB family Mg chelatase-like AAA ATPase [Spirochaetota bacterium]